MNKTNQDWVPWPRNPLYLVNKEGQIKGKSGKILKQTFSENRGGYFFVNVDKPNTTNERTKVAVHRILLETFCPVEGMENLFVDHIDGIRTNNSLNNLRWVTAAENRQASINNTKKINEKISELIQKYGYQEVEKMILSLS